VDAGDAVPDLTFAPGPGEVRRLADWGPGPWALIFLRHLA
jgi:hypothetical protein